ncbi:hypothetical protein MMYC01_209912 [Madurella mycetomatis]|uniref:Uncharacterized protein n=1 Tax=Madurella mycetomatis TaxID=100816 RepID=A0A175VQ62_9PEZI|nr:hypothetical protein MMYC01_209912 [Madurella mycetomatis]
MLPHDKFQCLIDLNNQAAVLLATHWIALKQIMAIITEAEMKVAAKMPERRRNEGDANQGVTMWLKHLNRLVDEQHRPYNQWPLWVEAQLDRDRGFFGGTF